MCHSLQNTQASFLFSDFLTSIHSKYNNILITGDFNLHIINSWDFYANEFLNLLNSMDFKQHITQPTHNRGHTLDLVITYGLSTGVSSVVDLGVSDHYGVFLIQQEALVRTVRKRYIPMWLFNFIDILHHTPAQFLPASCDFIVDYFNSKLKSVIDKVAKSVKVKTIPPWRNERIKQMKKNYRRAERKWRKTKLTIHLETYRNNKKITTMQ